MTNELTLQWRGLRDKLMRGDEEQETVPVMIETGDMLVREIERLTRERDVSRAAIEQLHAAVKTAQELAARRLMEVERLEAARKHWHEKWNEALTELDGYRTAEFRKNWNALNASEPSELRLLFNKGIGVQRGNGFSFAFPNEEDANQAFHYIANLGTLETSQPPLTTQGASRDASSKPYPAFMYCPKCGELYTGRGGTDGLQMTLTCPNQHSWTDPRPTELRT